MYAQRYVMGRYIPYGYPLITGQQLVGGWEQPFVPPGGLPEGGGGGTPSSEPWWVPIIRDIVDIIGRQQQPVVQMPPYPIQVTPQSENRTLTYVIVGIGAAAVTGLIIYFAMRK